MFESLRQDLRHGIRMLARNPAFSLVAIVSIATGVAACAAMFSVADGLVLRPLPVPRGGDLLTINSMTPIDQGRGGGLSYLDYKEVRDQARRFSGLSAHRVVITSFSVRREDQAQSRLGFAVSGNLFDVMEIRPALGRFFAANEDRVPGRDAVVVISHDTWTRQFGSDPQVAGKTMRLGGVPFTIIGVTPEIFTGPELVLPAAFYLPLAMLPAVGPAAQAQLLESRDIRMLTVKGRLAAGASLGQARAEIGQIGAHLQRAHPESDQRQDLIVRTHLQARSVERGPAAAAVAMLLTLAIVVLMVACANVAGLLTSQAPARAREMAVRIAIGAGRVRLVRQLVTEAALIAAAGGALGIGLGHLSIGLLQMNIITDIGVRITFATDARVLGFAIGLATVSALVAGLIPAWRSARVHDLSGALRQGASESSRSRFWGRHVLVMGQVALSLALVTVGVFLYRTFNDEIARGPGFKTDHVLLLNLDPGLARYDATRTNALYDRLKEQVRALPGVTAVGLASTIPLGQDYKDFAVIAPEGYQFPKGSDNVRVQASRIDEGFLDAMRVRILSGRGILSTDTAEAPRVIVVNQTLASHYWPRQSPLGKRVRLGDGSWTQVVGVAADGKYNFLTEAPVEFLYLARRQDLAVRATLVVASDGSTAALAGPVRAAVQSIDREVPITGVWTMEDYYDGNALSMSRTLTRTVGTIGLVGVGLAMVGLYGLVAYAVSRRTREIGLRMAVGAAPATVLRMVMRQGLGLTGVGTVAGIAIIFGVNGLLRGMFPSSHGVDLAIYALVVPALLAVTLLAALVPAVRASRIDPLVALRQD